MSRLVEAELDEFQENKQELLEMEVRGIYDISRIFRKLQALKTLKKQNQELVQMEKSRLDSWLENQNKNIEYDMFELEQHITAYYEQEKEKNPDFRLKTPYGSVTSRKTTRWNYDEEKLLKQVKEIGLNTCIRVKEEIDKAELKKVVTYSETGQVFTSDGEILEGVTVSRENKVSVNVEEC